MSSMHVARAHMARTTGAGLTVSGPVRIRQRRPTRERVRVLVATWCTSRGQCARDANRAYTSAPERPDASRRDRSALYPRQPIDESQGSSGAHTVM